MKWLRYNVDCRLIFHQHSIYLVVVVRGIAIRDYFKSSNKIWTTLVDVALALDRRILLIETPTILPQLGSGKQFIPEISPFGTVEFLCI